MFGAYLLISDFLAETREVNKNCKKDHSFYNQVLLKNLIHFTNHNLLNIVKM